jgi:hypothetical protein
MTMPEETPKTDPCHVEHSAGLETGHAASQWVERRVSVVRKEHPDIPDGPPTILTERLNGVLSEKPLSAGELTTLAKTLISAMVPMASVADAELEKKTQ